MTAVPDKKERRKIRSLYNKVGGAMVLENLIILAVAFVMTLFLDSFMTEQTDPETGFDIIGWAEMAVSFCSPAFAAIIMFFGFNAANKVKLRPMFSTEKLTPRFILRCVMLSFAVHAFGIGLEYLLDYALTAVGLQVTSFDYILSTDAPSVIINLSSSMILAPIAEELFFRGVVLKQVSRVSLRFGIFFSGIAFGIMHGNPYQFVMATGLGILFGYITVYSGSLIPSIICHMAVNTMMSISDIVGIINEDYVGITLLLTIAAEVLLGAWGIRACLLEGKRLAFPSYTEYHKKRTLPIMITSAWIIIIFIMYIWELCDSVEPIQAAETLGEFVSV